MSGIGAAKAAFAEFRAEVAKGKGAAATIREAAKATESAARSTARSVSQQEAALKRAAASARQLEGELRRVERRRAAAASATTRQEQQAIQAERQRLRAFQSAERAREQTSRRILAAMRRDEASFQKEQLRRLQELAARRAEVERQRLLQARAARAEQAALDRLDPEKRGQSKAAELVQRRAVAQAELAELRRLGREDLITKQLRRQSGELRDSARSANSLLFTFRRLVGVLAVFQIARAVVGGFRDLVVQGVRFNDEIRQAEISIAGLITGLADVRNEQGQSVSLGEEYARALGEARRQTDLLRQDALLTTATFEQLLDTFQIAIGPGFAAGLNLDEIRKLSVSISQAATAIGLPQNQLAEEIRSLLSGTIQARTTRIATALQITNADIRRLRATGELFDFLEEKFRALGLAAEQAARRTLSGIGNLVKDATSAILGAAAQPLFEELIRLGNEVFDQVLTIRDAAGNIRPNPDAVRAFRSLFEALREGVVAARELGRELGFEGLRNAVGTIGTALNIALQTALGFAGGVGRALNVVATVLRTIGGLLGLDVNGGLSNTSRLAGRLVADFLILKTVARAFGINLSTALSPGQIRATGAALKNFIATPLGKGGVIGLALAGVAKGFELILERIFGVNLGLRETIVLIQLAFTDTLDAGVTAFDKGIVLLAGKIKKAFSGSNVDEEIDERVRLLLQGLDEGRAATAKKALDDIAAIVNAARAAAGQLPGAELADRPAEDRNSAGIARFGENISNVESIVSKANTAIGELDSEMRKLAADFEAAGLKTGKQGFAGEVEEAFSEAASTAIEKSAEIREALRELQEQIKRGVGSLDIAPDREAAIRRAAGTPAGKAQDRAIEALKLTREEGQLVSFLRDEARLRETIADLELQGADAARLRVAIQARETLPALQRELAGLQQQAAAEGAIAAAVTQRLGARRLEAIEAQNALAAFRQESQERLRLIREDLAAARQQAQPLSFSESTAEERTREKERAAAAAALASELEKTLALEEAIAVAKEQQLEFAREQARLAAEGSFTAGIRAGLEQLANDLPTLFEAARALVQSITQTFVSAASQLFRDLFDPRVEVDLRERLGNLLLDVGQQIFEQILQTLIQSFLASRVITTSAEIAAATTAAGIKITAANTAAGIEIAAATQAAAIRAASGAGGGVSRGGLVPVGGFARGGRIERVPSLIAHARARGLARGGRPAGLPASDTVPAWLTPGEFIVRKSVVDSMGVGFFRAVNAGRFEAPPAGAPASSPGMARGGMVVRREPAVSRRSGTDRLQILPVQVTSEREMERLRAGSRKAFLQEVKDNAGSVRGILGF